VHLNSREISESRVASVDYKKKLKKIEEIMGQVSNEARLVTLVKSYEEEGG